MDGQPQRNAWGFGAGVGIGGPAPGAPINTMTTGGNDDDQGSSTTRNGSGKVSGRRRKASSEEDLMHELVIDYVSHQAFSRTARVLTTRPSLANESSINRSEAVAGAASNDGNGNDHAMDVDERPPTTATEAEASQPSGLAASTTAISAFSEPEIASMRNRKEIYDAILAGQISHAMTLIQAQFPWLLDTSREAGPGFREWMDEEMENGGGGDGDPAVDALATDIGYSNGYGGKVSGSGNRASLANTPRGDRGDGATRSQSNGGGSTPVTVNGLGVSTGVGSSSSIAGGSGGGPGAITNSFGSVGVNVSVNTHNANNTANKSSSSSLPSVASMDRDFTNGPQAPPLLGEDSAYPVPPFPYAHVLGRPTFLVLNLEIQAFVEGLREVAHSIPSSPPTTAGSSLASSMHSDMGAAGGTGNGSAVTAGNGNGMDSDASVRPGAGGRGGGAGGGGPPSVSSATATTRARDTRSILSCLEAAGGLHTRAKALPPKQAKVYGAEVEKVTALLAYTDMEASPLRGYLDPRRRLQLADMVNGALLAHDGRPPRPVLETVVRHTTRILQAAADHGLEIAPPWTTAQDGPECQAITSYLRELTGPIDLRDYIHDRL